MNAVGFWYAVVYIAMKIGYGLLHPIRVIGREHIPQGAVVISGNHTSAADPVFTVFALRLKNRITPMAKKELLEMPVVGFFLKRAGVISVNRGNNDVGAVKKMMAAIKGGEKILLYPEGGRVKEGEKSELKHGAAMFAVKAGAPILPVYVQPNKKKLFHRTLVVFGEPYYPQTEQPKRGTPEEYARITDDLMARVAELGRTYDPHAA